MRPAARGSGKPIHSQWTCDSAELERRTRPRDDVLVLESSPIGIEAAGDHDGELAFESSAGPFSSYQRTIRWAAEPGDDDERTFKVDQRIEFRLAIPYWALLFRFPVRRTLGEGPPPGKRLWWSTPDRLTARQSSLVAAVSLLNLVSGVLYGLITQVLTFAAGDLGDGSRSEQTSLLAAVRVGVVVTMIVMVMADRIGRRRVAIGAFMTSAVLTLLAALSPNLWSLGALQFLSRNLAIAGLLCADTIAVEEMPPGSRAMVSSLGTLAYGLGAGLVVMTLPLADLGPSGWRLTFLMAGASLPVIWHVRRYLPESRRYTVLEAERTAGTVTAAVELPADASGSRSTGLARDLAADDPPPASRSTLARLPTRAGRSIHAGHAKKISAKRLALVGAIFLLLNVFLAPASQLQNDYLRTEVGFSGAMISIFILLTSTPGGLGVLIGGRVADLHGRRWAIIPGLTALGVFYAWFFSSTNWSMWVASLVASIIGGMAAPALGVIAPELFPTARRGTVRGVITGLAVAGSVIGLVISGVLIDSRGYSVAFMALALSALAAAALAFALPETRGRELEDINR